jgi:hypothetical protein
VDVQTNVGNCGACGNVCTGQCALGRCLVNLASANANASGEGSYNVIAVDSTNVYWVFPPESYVVRVPIAGGATVTSGLILGASNLTNIALGPNGVYAGGDDGVFFSPFDGGTGGIYPPDAALWSHRVMDLVAGPNLLYWTDPYVRGILAAPYDGGPATVVATDEAGTASEIVSGPSAVYWNYGFGDASVVSAAVDGGAVTVEPWGADASQIVWAAGDLYLATNTSISRVPGGQGAPILLVSGAGAIATFAADATNIYWSDKVPAVIMSEPKLGGSPTTLVTNQGNPASLVVDSTSLYWIDISTQELVKLTPK